MVGKVLFQKQYPREDLNESSNEIDEKQIAFQKELPSSEGFIDHLLESITLEPLPQKEEGVERFIQSAIEISDFYELDIEIRQFSAHVRVNLSFDCGASLKGMSQVFAMADELSFATGIKGRDLTVSMDYYTHAVYLNGRQIEP